VLTVDEDKLRDRAQAAADGLRGRNGAGFALAASLAPYLANACRAVPYKDAEATAADVLLLIEVAETSLRYDRTVKLRLYAEASVGEYWVVDCDAEAVEVHRAPTADGYREVTRVTGEGTVSPAAFPDVRLTLAEIFA
jgi:Uma2 family endonuclease